MHVGYLIHAIKEFGYGQDVLDRYTNQFVWPDSTGGQIECMQGPVFKEEVQETLERVVIDVSGKRMPFNLACAGLLDGRCFWVRDSLH